MDVPIDLDRDELLTLTEAAHLLRVGPATAYRWALKGRLRCWRREGRLVTTKGACEALLVPLAQPPPAFRQPQRAARMNPATERTLREAGILP